jgi:hypothetical protein
VSIMHLQDYIHRFRIQEFLRSIPAYDHTSLLSYTCQSLKSCRLGILPKWLFFVNHSQCHSRLILIFSLLFEFFISQSQISSFAIPEFLHIDTVWVSPIYRFISLIAVLFSAVGHSRLSNFAAGRTNTLLALLCVN